ncbi:MAG: hypothetical protein JW991_01895 [Candidatus Pacebacteria bacterium]|nr:hypothetical protein [Candidatus Paceibacterota bacterium]
MIFTFFPRPSSFLDYLPQLVLLLTLLADTFEFIRGDKKKVKISFKTLLAVGGLFIYYALLLNSGIEVTKILFDREIQKGSGSWVAISALTLGYFLTKMLYLKITSKSSRTKISISYQVFLRYFVFTTGAVIFFIFIFFGLGLAIRVLK